MHCMDFVNADEIARGLSPFQPERMAFEAGRLMLKRIDELMETRRDFAFETTLSSRSILQTVHKAMERNYHVVLIFFWLPSSKQAIRRVQRRVREGGHNIPEETIVRRYKKGIQNLFDLYVNVVDSCFLFDNSCQTPRIIAGKTYQNTFEIIDHERYQALRTSA